MKALLVVLLAIGAVFAACLLGALMGALAGWVVGLIFDDTMALLGKALGIPDAAPYQIGALLGFAGGFFRSAK